MLFFEEFVKKVEEAKDAELSYQDKEYFGLGKRQKLVGYGLVLPLFFVAAYEIALGLSDRKYYLFLIAALLLYICLKRVKTLLQYRMMMDMKGRKFHFQKVCLNLDDMASVCLREAKIGKKVIPVLDFISLDQKQVIIPMYMNKKLFLVQLLRKILGARFSVKK